MTQVRFSNGHAHMCLYLQVDENVVSKCGKMLILDRMLAQLKQTGHKVSCWLTV